MPELTFPHEVTPAGGRHYEVKSGDSGKTYQVIWLGGRDCSCDCASYSYRAGTCKHGQAVLEWLEEHTPKMKPQDPPQAEPRPKPALSKLEQLYENIG